MIQTLAATLLWALVASLLILRRKRTDRSITYATTIATAMPLNDDTIYTTTDPLLGGRNATTLVADSPLLTGLFFLGRGVMRTGEYRPRLVRAAVSIPTFVASQLAISIAFLLIDHRKTTTQFMNDLGDQPAAAVYSMINSSYSLVVTASMLTLAAGHSRRNSGIQRFPPTLLALGSAFGVTLSLTVIIMDIAHVTGHLGLMHTIQPTYGPLVLLTFLFLCSGFATQPAIRRAQQHLRARRTTRLTAQLEPLWNRATKVRPGLSPADPEGRLHRQIVEIHDAMIDPRVTFDINHTELTLLEQAKAHLLGHTQAPVTHDHRAMGMPHDQPRQEPQQQP